jgi:outer membrane protein
MKKIISITFLAAAIIFSLSANAQQKSTVAHISLDSLLKNMPESDTARKVGQAYYQQLEQTIEAMQKELQTKYQDYQANQATYTGIVKQNKESELQDLNTRIQNFQQQAQGSLQKFNDSLTRPIITKAKNAINTVAKEHGYKYVLDTSSGVVIYYEDTDNIYPMVAEKLGIKPKKAAPPTTNHK